MPFANVVIEGGLFPAELLDRVAAGEVEGQHARDFGLGGSSRLSDAIQGAFSDARSYWDAFIRRRAHARESGTTLTREFLVIPVLELLGFSLVYQQRSLQADGESYAISHRAGEAPDAPPVHVVAIDQQLGARAGGARSPHALVQDYLNRSDALWGVVTNGRTLRLLRNSARLSRPTFVDVDLAGTFESNSYSDFVLLYRLLHRTRFPTGAAGAHDCLLERYYQQGIEEGGRVREHLREGVEQALLVLGNAFLAHPDSAELRRLVRPGGELPAQDYYRQLLRLVYRLLFLMVAEERKLLFPAEAGAGDRREVYTRHYSVARLRERCERHAGEDGHADLWRGLCRTFEIFRDDDLARRFGTAALNGELFGPDACRDLEAAGCDNASLLRAMRHLSTFVAGGPRRRVNYAALDVEELGSVYESLLDYRPVVASPPAPLRRGGEGEAVRRSIAGLEGESLLKQAEAHAEAPQPASAGFVTPVRSLTTGLTSPPPVGEGPGVGFDLLPGGERKTTGSYYTPPELVRELIESALVPVMAERLAGAKDRAAKEAALLGLRVCDPASGSGHFLLAAARRIARELARVRTGEEEPAPEAYRAALRDVIRDCIYAVDKNPLAVDLCKVALWIEGHNVGMPLSFLDHHVKCGDSLVGVFDLAALRDGIPDGAYTAVTGDDKKAASAYKKRNKDDVARLAAGQATLEQGDGDPTKELAARLAEVAAMPERTAAEVRAKAEAYALLRNSPVWRTNKVACDLWTYAFFAPLRLPDHSGKELVPTTATVHDYLRAPNGVYGPLVGAAEGESAAHPYFHWPLELPDVWRRGGFDVVLGNPPWERVKLQEVEFFAGRDPEIKGAKNKAERDRLIAALPKKDPGLHAAFQRALHAAEAQSVFLRESGRFPLCGRGDVNTYAVFAEAMRRLAGPEGRAGIIVPTGIATDDTTKLFFQDLVRSRSLASLYDFENREAIFPSVHRSYKFCLLTVSGRRVDAARFAFFATGTAQLAEEERRFALTPEEIALLNPNTGTCPVFRTRRDADLTKEIYRRVPVLVDERTGANPWGVAFLAMFHMSNDSHLFRDAPGPGLVPLYEAELLHQFDHRWATYVPNGDVRDLADAEKADPDRTVTPRYWVPQAEVEAKLAGKWDRGWLLGFRDITNTTNERTAIFSLLPRVGVGNKVPLVFVNPDYQEAAVALLGCVNSLAFDYAARQKVGGTTMNFYIVKQLPVLPPDAYTDAQVRYIGERVLELVYTAWDMRPFAKDMGYDGEPFAWDPERRARLRAELDGLYARLYGLSREDLCYVLDTFPILKRKDEATFGEYRTRRLVLEAYDELGRRRTPIRPSATFPLRGERPRVGVVAVGERPHGASGRGDSAAQPSGRDRATEEPRRRVAERRPPYGEGEGEGAGPHSAGPESTTG